MSNSSLLLRSLLIYAIVLPSAIILGCLLATPEDKMSVDVALFVLGLLLLPLLLRWHHFWLIAVWNTQAMLFFIRGSPTVALAMSGLSLLISVLQHTLNRRVQFIHVRELALPVLFLGAVILVTAKLTGGIGLQIAGSDSVGGKRYVYMLGAILGYFALSAHRIPLNKAVFYVAVFFLTGATAAISDLAHFIPPSILYYVLLVFPPFSLWEGPHQDFVLGDADIGRLGGIAGACSAVVFTLLAVYGISGIFKLRKFWRAGIFLLAIAGSLYGGYRSILVTLLLTIAAVFWLEGLFKSRMLPVVVCFGILLAVVAVPFADHLPLTVQRTLSVVPFVPVSQFAKDSAQGSTDWRVKIWHVMWPQVPNYLLLGKGLSINAADLAAAGNFESMGGEATGSILAGDYHNGPLSVIIPFGLAGALGFLWLLGAGTKALYYNYRYGDEALRHVNTFLLAVFIAKAVFFFAVFGAFASDLTLFVGWLGLSVAINGGVRKPAPAPAREAAGSLKLAPAHADALH